MPLFGRRQRDTGPEYALVTTNTGKMIGFWIRDPRVAHDSGSIHALMAKHDLAHHLGSGHRIVANTVDHRGGLFVMFADHLGPGETKRSPTATVDSLSLEVNGTTYPLREEFELFTQDAAAGNIALLKTPIGSLSTDELSGLFAVLAYTFGEDSPETYAVIRSGFHCLYCFQRYRVEPLYLRHMLQGGGRLTVSSAFSIKACMKCGARDAVWIYDPLPRTRKR